MKSRQQGTSFFDALEHGKNPGLQADLHPESVVATRWNSHTVVLLAGMCLFLGTVLGYGCHRAQINEHRDLWIQILEEGR